MCQQPCLPGHQRSHCYLLFWPRQETSDPGLDTYFHGRTEAVCGDTEEPGERVLCQPALGARALLSLRRTRGVGGTHWVAFAGHCRSWVFRSSLWGLQGRELTYSLPRTHSMESLYRHGGPLPEMPEGQGTGRGPFALGSLEGGQLERAACNEAGP